MVPWYYVWKTQFSASFEMAGPPPIAPAAAAGAVSGAAAVPFEEWASRQRRRAALDGAWKVEVVERVMEGTIMRAVKTWHDNTSTTHAPMRRVRQVGGVAGRPLQRTSVQHAQPAAPSRQSARQRRSALRSAAHHRQVRMRVLRRTMLVVRFIVRLSRLTSATRALREVPSPGKRRHSPPPPEASGLISGRERDEMQYSSSPPPKRFGTQVAWLARALSHVQRVGDG